MATDKLDLRQVQYSLIIYAGSTKYVMNEAMEDLGWEEGDSELSTRITFSLSDTKTAHGHPSEKVWLGRKVVVRAKCGDMDEEVARGMIVEWTRKIVSKSIIIKAKCYGPMIAFRSQIYAYFPSDTNTTTIFKALCKEVNVKIGEYKGPNKSHGKTCYKSKTVANAVTEMLDDAKKRGSEKYVILEKQDKIYVYPYGYNKAVWQITGAHVITSEHGRSIEKIVTRVQVIGQADDDGKAPVEATVNGKTKFGIRQKLVTRGKDESIEDAQSTAQDILDDEGRKKETITLTCVDVPFIHKGEKIHIKHGSMNDYYYVSGVSHDASRGTMTLKLKTEKYVK